MSLNVGLDISALAQTRAGTARYVEALMVRNRYELLQFGGSSRLATVARDALWYPVGLPVSARRLSVLHCPTFRAPLWTRVPLVVTVLDLAVLRHPGMFNRWSRHYSRLTVPRVVRSARRLIAISEFTKSELVAALGVEPERVRVIPVAHGDAFTPEGPRAEGEYVLAVGTLEPRKNLGRAIEAARRLKVELRVVGAYGWGGVDARGTGVRWLGDVDDDHLARLYRGALALVYPSLYEGFGIPILEAMACGTPVVTSRGGATEEVAGGAAVLVDPLDPAAIAAGVEEASARSAELVELGRARAAQFSWNDVARDTWAVYEEAAA